MHVMMTIIYTCLPLTWTRYLDSIIHSNIIKGSMRYLCGDETVLYLDWGGGLCDYKCDEIAWNYTHVLLGASKTDKI